MDMTFDKNNWSREVTLLRPTVLTEAIFENLTPPDPRKPWIPETLLPLFGGVSFEKLSGEQRLRYNHSYARQLVAEFIWLERFLIRAPLLRLLNSSNLDKDILLILCSFVADETNHIASFEILEEKAAAAESPPVFDSSRLFSPPILLRRLAALAARLPLHLTFWSDVIIPLEEKAIKIGQLYMRDESVDPSFREVFVSHARDEARHCRLDNLFSTWLHSIAGNRQARINKRLELIFQRAYYSNQWGLEGPIDELIQAFPEIADQREAMMAETTTLRTDAMAGAQNP